jgi:hypothetical protein
MPFDPEEIMQHQGDTWLLVGIGLGWAGLWLVRMLSNQGRFR